MKSFFSHFKGDAFGGITAGVVALPLALAFGLSSGLGPSAGLYGAIFLSILAAFFGGTPTQISGPTAPMTAVSMVVIAGILATHDGQLNKALPFILMVFLLAGLMQIGLGTFGFGKYIKYIPYPVVSGFMTAIGVIILITQIPPLLGYYAAEDQNYVTSFIPQAEEVLLEKILEQESQEGILVLEDFHQTIERANKITEQQIHEEAKFLAQKQASGVTGTFRIFWRALQQLNWTELILALLTIGIIYGFKRITKSVPSTLVALIIVSAGAYYSGILYRPIPSIPEGFPQLQMAIFKEFNLLEILPYLGMAVTLALLGAIDSLLTSIVADNLTKTRHLPNKELVGQGIGNSIGALFGGIPGAGATIRTVVNIQSGGKTRLSGIIAGAVLLIILLVLGPMTSKIPAAVLAGILVTVGIGVMDFKGLKAIPKIPREEVLVMLIVLVLSVVWNLVYAVGVGLILAALFFMKKMGDLTLENSKVIPVIKEKAWVDEKDLSPSFLEQIFIKHINGPLFFGFTTEFLSLSKQIPQAAELVILRMSRMPYIDQSGLYALEDVLIELKQKEITPLLVGVKTQPEYLMRSIGLIDDLIPEEHIFDSFNHCRMWIRNHHKRLLMEHSNGQTG
ncbi:MAG: SulP family inorganic anion transporter [Flavobacteriaceae bacterium]